MDMIKMEIFIQEQRKRKQLSQKQLAEYLHVSPTTVCKWEKGIHLPDISNLELLSELFQVSIQELLDGTAAPVNTNEIQPQPPVNEASLPIKSLKTDWKKAIIALITFPLLIAAIVISIHFLLKPRFEVTKCFYPTYTDLGNYAEDYNPEELYCIIVEYDGFVKDSDFENYDSVLYNEYCHYFDEIDVLVIAYYPKYNPEVDTISSSYYICFYYF